MVLREFVKERVKKGGGGGGVDVRVCSGSHDPS